MEIDALPFLTMCHTRHVLLLKSKLIRFSSGASWLPTTPLLTYMSNGAAAHGVSNASRSSASTRLQMRSDPSPITAFFLNA